MSEVLAGEPPAPVSALSYLGGQIKYQIRLLIRTSRALVSAILLPALLLMALKMSSDSTPASTFSYLVAGAVVFSVISIGYVTHATGLVGAREQGVLKRLRGTALPAWCYLTGRVVATLIVALLSSAVALAVAWDVVHVHIALSRVPALALAVVIGTLCWAALGTAVAGLIPRPASAWPVLSLTYLPLLFISGVFFPATEEPAWVYRLAGWLPAQPFAALVESGLTGSAAGVGRHVAILGAWTLAGVVLSALTFRWLPRAGRSSAKRPVGRVTA
ncbi:ABC transporter permease [Paractinoplanes rhizophilus]|jgi:ABC-2 type transport system permease protein|uniref:Transport permease protein n=1 Tax=Paractinoplanes rhizophilus TaxID=1416877 RepID=A0ABW2HJV6_9ACTN|nr:ABC transporter permease [Actinoplanes sp.]